MSNPPDNPIPPAAPAIPPDVQRVMDLADFDGPYSLIVLDKLVRLVDKTNTSKVIEEVLWEGAGKFRKWTLDEVAKQTKLADSIRQAESLS